PRAGRRGIPALRPCLRAAVRRAIRYVPAVRRRAGMNAPVGARQRRLGGQSVLAVDGKLAPEGGAADTELPGSGGLSAVVPRERIEDAFPLGICPRPRRHPERL